MSSEFRKKAAIWASRDLRQFSSLSPPLPPSGSLAPISSAHFGVHKRTLLAMFSKKLQNVGSQCLSSGRSSFFSGLQAVLLIVCIRKDICRAMNKSKAKDDMYHPKDFAVDFSPTRCLCDFDELTICYFLMK